MSGFLDEDGMTRRQRRAKPARDTWPDGARKTSTPHRHRKAKRKVANRLARLARRANRRR